MNKSRFIASGLLLLVTLTGCDTAKPASLAMTGNAKAADAQSIPGKTSYSGRLTAVVETAIVSRVSGRVSGVHKDVGDTVNPGDVLVTLEQTDLAAQLNSARADLAAAEAKYAEIKRGTRAEEVRAAQAAYEQAYERYLEAKKGKRPEEIAKLETGVLDAKTALDAASVKWNRAKQLYNQGALAKQPYEDAELALKQADARYANAKSDLALARAGSTPENLRALAATAEQMKALLTKAENGAIPEVKAQAAAVVDKSRALVDAQTYNLANSTIKSPSKGIVATKTVQTGELASPAQPLMTIINLDEMYVSTSVPEQELLHIKTGQHASVRVESLQQTFSGAIKSISPKAEPDTNKFTVNVLLANPNHTLRSGMTGIITFTTP
ncbi:RND family efflux transporter MFP subunit [Aneurinibacillus soli]|uniref:Putative multidrug resistance protein EmrK n=1 Tax=Aneurinibacillus soli TaxID=1500254 RepID=A0A0U4WJZ4_9BACL|nr:efflux RND transporter periplasmic adaptor subunit [Aneurinibacillus soli]PYE63102.1 RND family efflux transporter MFP subunit [Aneurinibacillus soli]BAU28840.1 putative multidrug resistance protein EmrK [Aneurinibacillus soli]